MKKQFIIAAALAGVAFAAQAAVVPVASNITTSETWTADNEYHLQQVVYVEPGATLTIEAGTKIVGYTAVELGTDDSSALVVTRGAKIMANGTAGNPIVMTSSHDNGTWRASNSEWGNLTILGNAIIAEGNNSAAIQDGTCWDNMEGLGVSAQSEYGGNDDDDDSGVVRYVSLRFGGSVVGTANELNGLSLGGVGRETVIDHLEIMNNVDDGIEIWGGTVQMKYVSIWNIGDDSFDLDEGYRGKAQFGLIVQGYSTFIEDQGSGNGDNCFEMDGGEHPDNMQPYANPQIFNFTVIGEPNAGDQGMAFRDNMRLQVGNSIFMDIGERLVKFEGAYDDLMYEAFFTSCNSYDTNGVDFASLDLPYNAMSNFYDSSRSGMWSWVKDSIMYNISEIEDINYDYDSNGTNETTTALGFWSNGCVKEPANMPIVSITRDTTTPAQPLGMERVIGLDPRAANDAVNVNASAPNDGFFLPVTYAGAFSAQNNWLEGWTAADEFGLLENTGSNPTGPAIASMEFVGSTVSFDSVAGVTYVVESTTDLTSGSWNAEAAVTGDGTEMFVSDIIGSLADFKAYRVVVQ